VNIVVGIFPECALLESVIGALVSSGKDPKRLRVLCNEEVPTELANSGVQVVWLGDVSRTPGGGIITNSGGVGVPGMNNSAPSVLESDELLDALSDLNIPDGRTDDYARAVEDGRMVVGYPGDADSAAIKQLLASTGASIVEEF
jgi:hypothetical protein